MYERFENYLRAGFPCIWVNTLEPDRAERELAQVAKKVHGIPGYHWDVIAGLREILSNATELVPPVKAVAKAAENPKMVTFLWNLHRFLQSTEVIQAVQNAIPNLKSNGSCLVIIAPDAEKLPAELARFVVVWDFPLPGAEEIVYTMNHILQDADLPAIEEINPLVNAALGLTSSEAEDAFALSVVEKKKLDPEIIAREKAGALLRQAKITLERFPDRFNDLGGMDNLKKFTLSTANSTLSLGIFLLGVPGAGKSTFARCLGNELGIPTLSLDFGKMMGSLVGQSESAIRDALRAVDAMGRVILFIDEVDKGLAGAGSSGENDSGVKAGVAGTFLKWLSDRKPGQAYVVATANKISNIPPEYLRAERWDGLFYIDLPTRVEKDAIWKIWLKRFNLDTGSEINMPNDSDWTGAEIRSCCRISSMMDCSIFDAAAYVVPVAKSMSEAITSMREWAKGRCLSANSVFPSQKDNGRRIFMTEGRLS